ncbi:hypothetical protein D9613_002770 [Agrocybe pediades]|uniref:Cytochrome b561 domain-containing protein n=1 Tax=Agrocybe pediades TaxID=84607 RepID=A0A8H4VP98_9AGAR|nr:hypothetical protein D9613_002770 [Agrocybe pediades]
MVSLIEQAGAFRLILSLLVVIPFVPFSSAVKGDTACRHSLCVTATVDGEVVNCKLQPMGWVALGFGQRMVDTHSVIMWKNDDGTTTLSHRYASTYSEPEVVSEPPRVATLVEPKKSVTRPPHSTTFAFQIPVNRTLLASNDHLEHLVFAYSPTRPDKDPASHLGRHSDVGYFTFDLTKELKVDEAVTNPSTARPTATLAQGTNAHYKRVEKLIILHGFLVSVGFLVLLPAGSLIARLGRSFTPKWFKAHRASNMLVAFPVITLGVLLGPAIVYSKESFRVHFANTHEVFGIFLLFLYYAQVFLGRYIHNRRNELAKLGPITRPHPPFNILHIVLGVSIIAASFFQVRSGLQWWEALTGRGPITNWAYPLWKAWIIILPIAYFGGYALLPRQFRLERESAYAPLPVGATEAGSQTTRLLAEDEEGN